MKSKSDNKPKHCPDCAAYYTGEHTCDGLMKFLVKNYKDRSPISHPSDRVRHFSKEEEVNSLKMKPLE